MTGAAVDARSRNRWLALCVLCIGGLMIVLDATIVNVALPAIQDDLGFRQNDLAWVVNAYMVPFAGLLLLAGRVGDLVGQRRMFLAGIALFTLASLVCAAARTQEVLIAGRFMQGIGGAFASAVILAMVVTMFPAPGERARAIGAYAFVTSAGGSLGLVAGGVLTESMSWHWIFLVNLPIGILVAGLALWLVEPHASAVRADGADYQGAALVTGSLVVGVFAILQVTEWGWGDPRTLAAAAGASLLMAAFIRRQAAIVNPLVPLRLLRPRNIAGANVLQAFVAAGMYGVFFLGALYLQRVLGYSALEVGLAFLPMTLAMGALSLGFPEKLIMRFGARATLIPGVGLIVVALALLAIGMRVDGQYWRDVFVPFVLFGVGAGLSFPATMTLAMSGATPRDAGLASGVINTSMEMGGAVGLAVLATAATERSHSLVDAGLRLVPALASGYRLALLVATGLACVALAIAILVLRGAAPGRGVAHPPEERACRS